MAEQRNNSNSMQAASDGGGGRFRGAAGRNNRREDGDAEENFYDEDGNFVLDENAQRRDNDNDDNGDDLLYEERSSKKKQQEQAASAAAAAASASNILRMGQGGTQVSVKGTSSLRWAVVCAVLSNKPVTFTHLSGGGAPAALPAEAVSFLRLISQVTTGSSFSLSQDASELRFVPGLITAQGSIVHEFSLNNNGSGAGAGGAVAASASAAPADASRAIGYFVEPLLLLLPFSRRAASVTLVGASHSANDLCLHTLRTVTLRVAQAFGIEASLRVVRHSGSKAPGCAILSVSPCRQLKCAKLTEFGLVSRVRGISYGTDISPDLVQRAAVAAKGALLNFLPDVYVVTDIGSTSGGRSRGTAEDNAAAVAANRAASAFGMMLVAETTTKKAVVSQETTAAFREDPEEVGNRAARLLLDEISAAGCVDRHHQPLTLLLMALAPDDVSTVRLGQLTPAALSVLELMASFLSVRPVIKDVLAGQDGTHAPNGGCTVSCFGSATINLTKRSG